ncbi:MAG: hypothetical protein JW841_08225 [Deltaproteobacteria bacterium]|nr:hypothetical protein [Deltaproteobacteria bacterium]
MSPEALADSAYEFSQKTREICVSINDLELRKDVEAVTQNCLKSLAALKRIHLPQDRFEEGQVSDHDAASSNYHIELAPYVLSALTAVNHLTESVLNTFSNPTGIDKATTAEDFELEFDLVDGPTGEDGRLSMQKNQSDLSLREQVAEVAYSISTMLRSRVANMGPRLRHALEKKDVWPLLTELDESQHGLVKGVQGMLFGVLGLFNASVRREEILPEYRSAVREAVDLRAAIADLSYHITRFNLAIAQADATNVVPLVVGVADRLSRFATRVEYRSLRVEDKRSIIEFRRTLHRLRYHSGGIPLTKLRYAIEGFAKFLEAMHSINHREVLVVHDNQRLSEASVKLDECLSVVDVSTALGRLFSIVRLLSSVMGRYPDLDDALRNFGNKAASQLDVKAEIQHWKQLVKMALLAVG